MRRSYEKEMMDLPGNAQELLDDDLRNLRILNRYLGGHGVVVRGLERLVEKDKMQRFRLLDVGTGSGDIPVRITQWARRKGVQADIVALEPDPVTVLVAARRTKQVRGISVVRGDGRSPPFPMASFDFVLASQLLHHFSDEQIVSALRTWSRVARRAIIVSDLIRHPLAYHGIRVLTRVFTRNVMTLTDAPLSVRRSLTLAEWRELFRRTDIGPVQIFSMFPYRVLALLSSKGAR